MSNYPEEPEDFNEEEARMLEEDILSERNPIDFDDDDEEDLDGFAGEDY